MNLELIERMTELLNTRRARRNELTGLYEAARRESRIQDAKDIYAEAQELVVGNKNINQAIKNVKAANQKFESATTEEERTDAASELLLAEELLSGLAEAYGVEIDLPEAELPEEEMEEELVDEPEAEEEIVTEEKENHTVRNILLGGMLVGLGAGMGACMANRNNAATYATTETETQLDKDEEQEKVETEVEEEFKETTEPTEQETKIEDVDTELYGMTSAFTDASDEEQVMQRANDIYNTYINVEGMPEAMKQQLSVERIANFIRMANGEFALEDGQIDYNGSMFDEMGNFINSYHNATSFVEYGTDLEFKPTCVFFENDSLAHHSAAEADVLVKAIYEDIRNNDVDKFKEDSIAWGEFVRDTVIYNDFTGETISLWSMENEHKYPLLKSLTSVYAPSIMEYSIGIDLATRNSSTGQYGNTFGICIPFCYNAQNELEYMPLSEMIYHINETPMNHLAKRAGFGEEWAENNESLMVMAGLTTKAYFDSKYELEVGQSLKLK